jgi:hypothetical protein
MNLGESLLSSFDLLNKRMIFTTASLQPASIFVAMSSPCKCEALSQNRNGSKATLAFIDGCEWSQIQNHALD